jgi:hypothetical protein
VLSVPPVYQHRQQMIFTFHSRGLFAFCGIGRKDPESRPSLATPMKTQLGAFFAAASLGYPTIPSSGEQWATSAN